MRNPTKNVYSRSLNLRELPVPGDESFAISFSDETPVLRTIDGKAMYEVLCHDPGCMVMDRAERGLALLWNHDKAVQVGRAEGIGVDPVERKGIATIRFGSGEKARELATDVASGICQEISFGYQIRGYETLPPTQKGDYPTALVKSWYPYELSLVAIPASYEVGVGRAMGDPADVCPTCGTTSCPDCGAEMETPDPVAEVCPTCGAEACTDCGAETETECVGEDNSTEIEISLTVNLVSETPETEVPDSTDMQNACGTGTKRNTPTYEETPMETNETTAPVTMPQAQARTFDSKDLKNYSIGKAINGILNGSLSGLEREVSQEQVSRGFQATQIPTEAFMTRLDPSPAFAFGNTNAGSDFAVPQFGSYLELLLAGSALNRLGVPVMNLTQPTVFPAIDSIPTPTTQAEVDALGTAGVVVTRQVTFAPNILVSGFGVSRTALQSSPASLDSYLKNMIMKMHIREFDKKAIAKIVSQITGTVVGLSASEIAKYPGLVTKVQDVTDYNAGCAFLTTNKLLNELKLVKREATLVTPVATDSTILDWKAVSTSNIATIAYDSTPTLYSEPLVYGDWNYAAFASFGGGVNIVTDIYGANAYSDSVSLIAQAHWDAQVMNKAAFAKMIPE